MGGTLKGNDVNNQNTQPQQMLEMGSSLPNFLFYILVSWMSGLNQRFAKPSSLVIRTVGSNPTLTAQLMGVAPIGGL